MHTCMEQEQWFNVKSKVSLGKAIKIEGFFRKTIEQSKIYVGNTLKTRSRNKDLKIRENTSESCSRAQAGDEPAERVPSRLVFVRPKTDAYYVV